MGVPLGFVEGMEEVFGKARGALPWHSSKASLDIAPSQQDLAIYMATIGFLAIDRVAPYLRCPFQFCMDDLAASFGLQVFKVVSKIGGIESSFCGWI